MNAVGRFIHRVFLFSPYLFLFTPTRAAQATEYSIKEPFNHSAWDQFLKKYVNEEGEVNYRGVKENPQLLNAYLKKIHRLESSVVFTQWPREEGLALWLNAYHAALISFVIQHYPLREINDIPGAWDLSILKMKKEYFSLNDIRASCLIGVFHDEKIDIALSCGAKSCPKMRREAFTGPKVEGQLFMIAREFVNNEAYVQVEPEKSKVEISQLFDWYGADFKLDFGRAENEKNMNPQVFAVLSFLAHYLEDAGKINFLEEGEYKVKYLPFDWSLNEWVQNVPQTSALPQSK